MKEEEAIVRPKAQIQSAAWPKATLHFECEFWHEPSREIALGVRPAARIAIIPGIGARLYSKLISLW